MRRRRETSSERYKRVIRQRRIFVFTVFTIVVCLCIGLFTPMFGISEVRVVGNKTVSAEEIVGASGIELGENVFRFSKKKAMKNISELTYVENVSIKRKFLAKVEIAVKEAEPGLIFNTPKEFIVCTMNGRVLEKTDDVTEIAVPLVFGVNVKKAEPAKTIRTSDDETLKMNLEYIRAFYNTEHWAQIEEFYVGDISNFMMVLKSGMKVTFGSIDNLEALGRKIKMMEKILPQIKPAQNTYLDLTTDKGYFGRYTEAELEEMRKREEEAEKEKEEADKEKEEEKQEEQEEAKPSKEPEKEEEEDPRKKPTSNDGEKEETKSEDTAGESKEQAGDDTPKKPTITNPAN